MGSTLLRKLSGRLLRAASIAALALLAHAGVAGAGPISGGAIYSPSDVILNSTVTAKNAGKTFVLSSAAVAGLTASTVTTNAVRFPNGTMTGIPIYPNVIFPATNTIVAPFGINASTVTASTITITGRLGVGTTPDASAVFDASGTTRGVLFPRLTTAQRDAIGAPKTSLFIFNTSSGAYQFYNGSGWTELSQGNLSLGTTNGLSLSGTVLSLGLASSVSTGAVRAIDFNTFNNKLATNGNGSALTGLTKTQVGLSNVLNLDQSDADNLTSGTVGTARLGSGTANSSKYLRGDQGWATLNASAVGLGNVTNDAQVKVADYTQKGGILVGIGTGTFAVLAPGTDGFNLVTNSSEPTGVEWIRAASDYTIYPATSTAILPKGLLASTATFTDRVDGTSSTWTGFVHASTMAATNLRGFNSGDVTVLNNNGLAVDGNQGLFLSSASASQTGALNSADWTTFNSKTSTTATVTQSFPFGLTASTGVFSSSISATGITGTSASISGSVAASSVAVTNLVTAASATFTNASVGTLISGPHTGTSGTFSGLVSASSVTATNLVSASSMTTTNLTATNATIPLLTATRVTASTVTVSNGVTYPNGQTQLAPLAVTVNGTATTVVTSTIAYSNAFSGTGASNVTTLGINASSITAQGNTFNGNSQLVQTSAGGAYPALSGTAITGIPQFTSTSSWSAGQTFSSSTVTNQTVVTSTITNLTASTVTVSGQLAFSDGNIRSANTNFVVGISSFDSTTSSATTSSSSFVFSNIATTTALHKSTNVLAMWANGTWGNDTANDGCDVGFFRDSTFISNTNGEQRIRNPSAAVVQQSGFAIHWTDAPGDTSSHTYRVGFRAAAGGTCTLNGVGSTDAPILMLEIGK